MSVSKSFPAFNANLIPSTAPSQSSEYVTETPELIETVLQILNSSRIQQPEYDLLADALTQGCASDAEYAMIRRVFYAIRRGWISVVA
ncbi:MAG: hypothetical protein HC838_02305 [Spirulinaceae cyanobacterium RM2_2_10]|nr:hypothetical protein [Spirulinaceae cyanobacterium SM2_1_0]NJO19128.1 hypothetical protein [Spirulinaceae cyanobacterium RM2_2_10]